MRGDRYVALGLASVRASWFRDVANWSQSSALPLEFIKCISVEELRARLTSGRAFSAVLIDSSQPALDRDLVESAQRAGCAVLIVDDGRALRDWAALRVSAVLPGDLSRNTLLDALRTHATLIQRGDEPTFGVGPATEPGAVAGARPGRLIAVTGSGGTGASTVAMALAQSLAGNNQLEQLVLLADLALDADLAMLHDAGDIVPGVQELVEAHRIGDPSTEDVRRLTFAVPERGYDLLLGLRRHRDWTVIRPRAFAAALVNLRRAYRAVVADISPDLEGEDQCGSIDIEERNAMSRTTVSAADAVVIVGLPGAKGLLRLLRLAETLAEHGVPASQVIPVINRAPRSPRARAEITRAFATLSGALPSHNTTYAPVVHISDRRHFEDAVRDGSKLPNQIVSVVGGAVVSVLERTKTTARHLDPPALEPVPVAPGSLGTFLEEEIEQ